MKITVEISDTVYARLETLTRGKFALCGTVEDVIGELIDHAQQGVYRPGAWERNWLIQAFSDDFTAALETDPDAPMFQRVRRSCS